MATQYVYEKVGDAGVLRFEERGALKALNRVLLSLVGILLAGSLSAGGYENGLWPPTVAWMVFAVLATALVFLSVRVTRKRWVEIDCRKRIITVPGDFSRRNVHFRFDEADRLYVRKHIVTPGSAVSVSSAGSTSGLSRELYILQIKTWARLKPYDLFSLPAGEAQLEDVARRINGLLAE